MLELSGRSPAKAWAELAARWTNTARRKVLAGTIIFGLGVLLQPVRGYGDSLLGVHTKAAELVLMEFGILVQFWGRVDQNYHASPGKT